MNLLYLALISFIFIASSALSLSAPLSSFLPKQIVRVQKAFPDVPILRGEASFPILSGQAALVVDISSGVSLYEKDPDKRLLPASTTKIITALVALDNYSLGDILKVGQIKIDGQKMGLRYSEEISVENLLYGLLIYSANDAAEVLAQGYMGGRETFVDEMNQKAKDLHLENSLFSNPSGLDGNEHFTTARDLLTVSEYAMKNPEFAKIVSTKEKTIKSVDGKISHKLVNINELLGKVEGVLGVKTGWTENARENLVTYIERDSHKVMLVLLGSQDRFGETKELIDWIFNNYSWEEVKIPYSP